jgi:hypothetical protein
MPACASSRHPLHTQFLVILPRIEQHGRVRFRHLHRPAQEEVIAEMVALCWLWFSRLAERGRDATRFPSALATYAARAVNSGRRLCGQDPARDALSASAQLRHRFVVTTLPDNPLAGTPAGEALRDNTKSDVPTQVAFRLDFPAWRRSYSARDRRLLDDLMVGERTSDVAQKYGVSRARVSQLRRQFHDDWQQFNRDPVEAC